jgi:nucleotide-binding universal stress UspA family protein
MRILCCLDGTNSEQMNNAVSSLLLADAATIGLIYVIDTRPHREMERQRERFLRPHEFAAPRREQVQQAEQEAARDILEEGVRYFQGASAVQREGRPEREIINYAAQWNADLIVICSCSPRTGGPPLGPKSVGHVARFVLDHAPCPVLLVRPLTRDRFPLER